MSIISEFCGMGKNHSLESSHQPIGVSEYQLAKLLPDNLKSSLPSIEELEEELNRSLS